MLLPASLDSLSDAELAALAARTRWLDRAEDPRRQGKQIPPASGWDQLVFRAGRGFGKTQALVQWLWWECWRVPGIIGHAVAPTLSDMVGTLFEGPAGLLEAIPPECLRGGSRAAGYRKAPIHEIFLSNGSHIRGFGAADDGGRLRGPQCHCAIGDELREWDRPAGNLERAHSNLMMGVRLPYPDGTPARAVFATTPRAIPYLLNLYRSPGVRVIGGTSYENIHNLSPAFLRAILRNEGTRLGRVEIHAEDIDAEEGGIFQRDWFRLWPAAQKLPEFSYIVMSLDTAFDEEHYDAKTQRTDFSACGVWGVFNVAQCFSEAERKRLGVKSKYAVVLCDFWMERLGFPALLEKTRETYRTKWGVPGRRPDVVLIEAKGSGISLRQSLIQYGVPTWPYNPGRQSKTMRAHAAAPLVLQGMAFVPESAREDRAGLARDWAEPLLQQVCAFAGPGSVEHDDAVDMMTSALLYLQSRGLLEASPQSRALPDPDEAEERRQQEALRHAAREKRGTHSPYGA